MELQTYLTVATLITLHRRIFTRSIIAYCFHSSAVSCESWPRWMLVMTHVLQLLSFVSSNLSSAHSIRVTSLLSPPPIRMTSRPHAALNGPNAAQAPRALTLDAAPEIFLNIHMSSPALSSRAAVERSSAVQVITGMLNVRNEAMKGGIELVLMLAR